MNISSTQVVRILIGLIALLVVVLCGVFALRLLPFGGGSATTPTSTPQPSATPLPGANITISTPTNGSTVSSPIAISGTVRPVPPTGLLNYRLFDTAGVLIATGNLTVQTGNGGDGTFSGAIPYSLSVGGAGRIEVVELNPANGSVIAFVDVPVTLNAAAPLPTPLPDGAQAITIDSPPPGTEVGSPVVLTGRTARAPANNQLSYTVRDAANAQLGSGAFDVGLNADGSGQFTASLTFNLPPNGGVVVVEITEPGVVGAPAAATTTINLTVAPPQQIAIESPPAGTVVGSPVVITGRTTRFPFQGNLAFRFSNANGQVISEGVFPVNGQPGGPTTFVASLDFPLPSNGGAVTVEIFDQNAADGQVVASSTLSLNVSPPPQQIIIETPPAGTMVGSPVVLTGRTVRFPAGGQLRYRVRDAANVEIGSGVFAVNGAADGSATFTASLTFNLPPNGGAISVELLEVDPATGQTLTSSALGLTVAVPVVPPIGIAPTNTPVPVVPPIGIAPTNTPVPVVPPIGIIPPTPTATLSGQIIIIETPDPGTVVGSPLVVTGRLLRYPTTNELNYIITAVDGPELGRGVFPVRRQGSVQVIPFVGELTFQLLPNIGNEIEVLIYERDPQTQRPDATATIRLALGPTPRTGALNERAKI
jgi:hypothetical protein